MRWHRKWLRRLVPPEALNKLNCLSHLEDRLYELEARSARLARIALAPEFGSLFADLPPAEFQIFSQNGEDGVLLHLLKQTGAPVKRFLEIGIENARECNTAVLAFVLGWDGVMVEADPLGAAAASKLAACVLKGKANRVDVRCLKATPGNVNDLIEGPELGVLSIDVDGMDYWLWQAYTQTRPRLAVIEYNASFGPERAVTVPYSDDFSAAKIHPSGYYHGASLAALEKLGRGKGYSLVATDAAGVNAFFVAEEARPSSLIPLSAAQAYRPHRLRCLHHTPDEQWRLISHLPLEQV